MRPETTARLVQSWVRLYTGGLPSQVRDDRREEVESDIWSQLEDARQASAPERGLALAMLARLATGIPADLSWRLEQIRLHRHQQLLEFRAPRGLAAGAVLAAAGGMSWVVWPNLMAAAQAFRPFLDAFQTPVILTFTLGGFALALAVVFAVFSLADSVRPATAMIGTIGASIGAISVLGAYQVIAGLALGSALAAWELQRLGLLSMRLKWTHTIAAAAWAVPLTAMGFELIGPGPGTGNIVALAFACCAIYGVTWIAIGRSLRQVGSRREAVAPET